VALPVGKSPCADALLRSIVPGMMARKNGYIINIASMGGCQSWPDLSAYVASKTALIRFSEQLALELEPYGVSVFSIHPGTVRTAMAEEARHILPVVQQALDAQEVKPDVAADLILFLASGKANALNGRFFSVDRLSSHLSDSRCLSHLWGPLQTEVMGMYAYATRWDS
jgi:NAD(P)-dependent dehydrogenase (short-subunit alcohol dehydrogenase family)